ncbi:immunoglobulin domain-containing protein [Leifsonia poae]|uniref:immunoglobulin domain-containing protein n=1 Tax=Leifsonia poae TaxID=110933 RepID=UPI001CBACB91|nr:immunoglobulin domain-containing protein [Leifsonia poae]
MAKKVLAALIVGAALALAVPAAANATPYTAGGACSISPTVVSAGQTATLTCDPGTFKPSEDVAYTVSGQNGATASLASYRTSVSSAHAVKAASSDGSAILTVTVPQNADGAYTITGTGEVSKAASAATVTVLPADAPAAKTAGTTPSSTGIASTGSVIGWYIAWIGGALVVAGLIVLGLLAARRRRTAP